MASHSCRCESVRQKDGWAGSWWWGSGCGPAIQSGLGRNLSVSSRSVEGSGYGWRRVHPDAGPPQIRVLCRPGRVALARWRWVARRTIR